MLLVVSLDVSALLLDISKLAFGNLTARESDLLGLSLALCTLLSSGHDTQDGPCDG